MRSTIFFSVITFSILCASNAQDANHQKQRVYFSVLDRYKKPVIGLQETDFELTSKAQKTSLSDFLSGKASNGESVPIVSWILLDTSAAVPANFMEKQADCIPSAFSRLGPRSSVGVITFDDNYKVQAPHSNDFDKARDVFRHFEQLRSGPADRAFADALEFAIDDLIKVSDPHSPSTDVRRAVLIVSNWSVTFGAFQERKERIYEKAIRGGISFYPVCTVYPLKSPNGRGNWK